MKRRGTDGDPFKNVYVRLVSSGLLERRGGRAAVLSLVSRLRDEGVTTMCVGLARTMAAAGKRVLLVDADPLGTRAGRMLGLSADPLSSTDRTPDLAVVQAAIAAVPTRAFDILVVSGAGLATEDWSAVWNAIKERYDAIIVDAGSLESDLPHRWRNAIDKALLVMDPQRATYEILERFRADLDHFALPLSGFIMNRRAFPVPAIVYRLAS